MKYFLRLLLRLLIVSILELKILSDRTSPFGFFFWELPSSETQGRSVGPREKARQKFSNTGGKAPRYRLSPDHFQTVKWLLAPDWAQKMLCIIVPNRRTAFTNLSSYKKERVIKLFVFFNGCQNVVIWRTSQWNLCKISLYQKWILSPERAKWVFSNFNKRTRYLGKLITECFITLKSYRWAKSERNSNFELVPQKANFWSIFTDSRSLKLKQLLVLSAFYLISNS